MTAIHTTWPTLEVVELPELVRFLDPNDKGPDGRGKPVIDVMMPLASFQQTILKEFVVVDPKTGHRLPMLEGALVAKYAPMVSLTRSREKKEFDAGDFRRIARTNKDTINRDRLHRLAEEVFLGTGDEILQFLELSYTDEAFPI